MAGLVPAIHAFLAAKTWMPAPAYAFGFDPAQQLGAPKLLSEGGKAGHDER
jgi:hypothetical protein